MFYRAILDGNGVCLSTYGVSNDPPMVANEIVISEADVIAVVGGTWDGKGWTAPIVPHREDVFSFKARFTPQERVAIRTAATSDPYTYDFMDMLDTAGMAGVRVNFSDALVLAGLQHLVDTGVIVAQRRDAVLVP